MKKTLIISVSALVFLLLAIPALQAAEPSKVILVSTHANATVKTNSSQDILWSSENFPKDGLININLIKKTSDSPAEYTLVRALHTNIANTGTATWTPTRSEIGSDLMIEIGCSSSTEYPNGCISGADSETFAVKGGFSDNLASAFDGFIAFIKSLFGR